MVWIASKISLLIYLTLDIDDGAETIQNGRY